MVFAVVSMNLSRALRASATKSSCIQPALNNSMLVSLSNSLISHLKLSHIVEEKMHAGDKITQAYSQ